jgi:hypothetical protein
MIEVRLGFLENKVWPALPELLVARCLISHRGTETTEGTSLGRGGVLNRGREIGAEL